MDRYNDLDGKSLDIINENKRKLQTLFPDLFTEGKIDLQRFRSTFDDVISNQSEHYELNWAGKSDARREIQRQTSATLTPDRDESVNFDSSNNILIEGENLEVLRVLQKSYFGKIKVIYIDPPYNTGNDFFVYPDDYTERLDDHNRRRGITDEKGYLNKLDYWKKNNKEGAYHSNWLSMIYPRLYLSRNLLREDGVIFVSIDDNEASNLNLLMDEIFGSENFVVRIIWKKRSTPPNDKIIGANHEYIYVYSKSKENLALNLRSRTDEQTFRYKNPDNHPKGVWAPGDLMANVKGGRYVKSLYFPIANPNTGEKHYPSSNGNWRFNEEKIKLLLENKEIFFGENGLGRPKLKRFLCDVKEGVTYPSIWDFVPLNTQGSKEMANLLGNMNIFDNPKPVGLLLELLQLGTDNESIVLDFFAGSGTTAEAVMELNARDSGTRRFICVQLPEKVSEGTEAFKAGHRSIVDICKSRIVKAIEKFNKADVIDPSNSNVGFRMYKLAKSNFNVWKDDIKGKDAILDQLKLFQNSEIDGSTNENMLYELLLKIGMPLTVEIQQRFVENQIIYIVNYAQAIIFFDYYNSGVKEIISELNPLQVICLDRVFRGSDEALTNLKLELSEKNITLTII